MTVTVTAYLAGPMRRRPRFNFPAFFKAEARLTKAGFKVLNPARADVEELHFEWRHRSGFENLDEIGFDLQAAHDRDELWIRHEADIVIVLKDWQTSRGALDEVRLARSLNKPVLELKSAIL